MTDKAKRKRKKRIFRVVLTIAIIAAAVFIGLGILRRVLNKSAEGSPGIVMTTAVVQRGDVARSLGVSSSIIPSETEDYKSAAHGEVLEVSAEEGDFVNEGTVVVRISTEVTDDLIESIEEQISMKSDQIESLLDAIDSNIDAISSHEDEIAARKEDIADLLEEIRELEADLAENEALRDKLIIYSPIDGMVFDIAVEEGDTVSDRMRIATVTNPLEYEVELPFSAKILDSEITEVTIQYKNSSLPGEIESIADYTYTDAYGKEMVDVLLSFSRYAALPDDARVTGTITCGPIPYKCIVETAPYYSESYDVYPEVQGEVLRIRMANKQAVSKGDILVELDSGFIDDASDAIENQIETKKDQADDLRDANDAASDSITNLSDQIAGFEEDIDELNDDISGLKEDLDEASEGYAEAELKAEFDGYVVNLSVEEGDDVAAGQSLFILVGMDGPQLNLTIDELDIPELMEGLPAEVTVDALPETTGKPLKAEVRDIALSGNTQGGVTTYTVTIELLDNIDGLRPGMTGTGTIFIGLSEDTLFVPIEAVTFVDGKSYVWLTTKEAPDKSGYSEKETGRATAGKRPASNYNSKTNQGAVKKDTSKMTAEQKADYENYLKGSEKTTGMTGNVESLEDYYKDAKMVEVTTGIHNETQIEILSGVEEGQIVLLPPVFISASSETEDKTDFNMGAARKAIGGYNK